MKEKKKKAQMPYDDIINSHTAGWRNRRKPWCNLTVSVMFSSTTKSVRRSSDYLTTILRVDPEWEWEVAVGKKMFCLKRGDAGSTWQGMRMWKFTGAPPSGKCCF